MKINIPKLLHFNKKLLIYTDSRGDNIPSYNDYDHYAVKLSHLYPVEKYLCPEKWTTTLDFLELIKTKNINRYYKIILHTGIVDQSPRHQQIAINKIYYEKKAIFDEVFGEKNIITHLNNDFGIEYENDKTINMYSLKMAQNYLIPRLMEIPNLLWISHNKIVNGWNGNYWKPRPTNINIIERYSELFLMSISNTINLMSWSKKEIMKYTHDNMHPNKLGSEIIYKLILDNLKNEHY